MSIVPQSLFFFNLKSINATRIATKSSNPTTQKKNKKATELATFMFCEGQTKKIFWGVFVWT